ncbi:hypothetical protein HDV05_004919 [Chytridiales sp. JEL 0842]|nr:hypothetical protein HDV05_004919 [Chytridiales sp. JEL 0842]
MKDLKSLLNAASAVMSLLAMSVIMTAVNPVQAELIDIPRPNKWRTRWPPLPTEMRHHYYSKTLKQLEVAGNLTIGPWAEEDDDGHAHIIGAIQNKNEIADQSLNCFVASISIDGKVSRASLFEKAPKKLIYSDEEWVLYPKINVNFKKSCMPYDSYLSDDTYQYAVVAYDGKPALFRFTDDVDPAIDTEYTSAAVDEIADLLDYPAKKVTSAAVSVDGDSGVMYTAWTMANSTSVTVHILKHEGGEIKEFTKYDAGLRTSIASPDGLHVYKSKIMLTGTTRDATFGSNGANPLPVDHVFLMTVDDAKNVPKKRTYKAWNLAKNSDLNGYNTKSTGLCFDKGDGSIYIGANTDVMTKSALYKIPTVLPFYNVTLPMKTVNIPSMLTSNVGCVDNGVVFIGTFDFGKGRQVIVFSNDLKRRAPVAFSSNKIENPNENLIETVSPFMYVHPSRKYPGTLLMAGNNPQVYPQIRRAGFKSSVVRLVHRKTNLHVTMMRDGQVALFPAENKTMHQVWEINPFSDSIVNLATKWALTVRGHPKYVENYDQQNFYIVTGSPYAHRNNQRWYYDAENSNIVNMRDFTCVGLDREYLRESRFPGKGKSLRTGLKLVTTYCQSDLLLKFVTIKPDIF